MSKKLIAVFAILTVAFVCVFAACEKQESIYADEKELDLVTNESGEKVLADDGQLLVYATDEDGEYVTNKDGEKETVQQQFQPLENDGVIEDYGFKLALPDGWKADEVDFGKFENANKNQNCEVSIVKYYYSDYYNLNRAFYDKLAAGKNDVNWEDEVDLGKDFEGCCRFTVKSKGNVSVMYFFENSKNVYKVLFTGPDSDSFISDTEAFCKSLEFKDYEYYENVTAVKSESETSKENKVIKENKDNKESETNKESK